MISYRTKKFQKMSPGMHASILRLSESDRDANHVHLLYIAEMPWITMKMAYPFEYYANSHLKYKINA